MRTAGTTDHRLTGLRHDAGRVRLRSLDLGRYNAAVFSIFAYSFTRPRTAREWRSFGAFSAFLVALFAEMYGFPLTIYLLSGWLHRRYPELDLLSHDAGHLWGTQLGWKGNPHLTRIFDLKAERRSP
jgi:hypothetical protein